MRAPNENVYALFNKEKFHFTSRHPEHTMLKVPCSTKRAPESTCMTFSTHRFVNYF